MELPCNQTKRTIVMTRIKEWKKRRMRSKIRGELGGDTKTNNKNMFI
jgi:hypothetical protein